jgi:hypothetical protein
MANGVIQQQFGEKVIEAFAGFARADLDDPARLRAQSFDHIADGQLRTELSQVFYGARWIYKLGLALLTKDEERAAHVRAQIVDYASVCEALLSYCIAHAIRRGHTLGTAYRWSDPDHQNHPITWHAPQLERTLARQTLWWLVRISHEFRIINLGLERELQWLREQRNTVHLRARAAIGPTAFLNQSRRAFEITTESIRQTKLWRAAHP